MNILYINTKFHEGGAAKIARQLYYGMKKRGHQVYFMAGYPGKEDGECEILFPSVSQKIWNTATGVLQNNQVITRMSARKKILRFVREKNIDLIHFHNIFENYIGIEDIEAISRVCPVVWTLHDMWATTGHCAYAFTCDKWKSECIGCKDRRKYPAFYYNDVAWKYRLKARCFTGKTITYVAPSHWLAEICRQSHLKEEEIHVIENGVDLNLYKPLDQTGLRKKYGISEDKVVIFFTAAVITNEAKGMSYLMDALKRVRDTDRIAIVTAGSGEMEEALSGFTYKNVGFVKDETVMNELYNLADLYVTTSMADNFPCTVLEAESAGTPVIAFTTGGIREMVDENIGWQVEPGNTQALYETIQRAVSDRKTIRMKGVNAREKAVADYGEERMVERYEKLYQRKLEQFAVEHR